MRTDLLKRTRATFEQQRISSPAFSQIELLVVVAISGFVAALLLPALILARLQAQATYCANNLKQLQLAWGLYPDDNCGKIPPNQTPDEIRSPTGQWIIGSARRDASPANIQAGVLFPYIRCLAPYHCPADNSIVDDTGGSRSHPEEPVRRFRSYSISSPWMGGETGHTRDCEVRHPADESVFWDENEDSIDNGGFGIRPEGCWSWNDLPACRHGRRGVLSFADGHSAIWRWRKELKFHGYNQTVSVGDKDLLRVQKTAEPN